MIETEFVNFYDYWLTQYTLRNAKVVEEHTKAQAAYKYLCVTGFFQEKNESGDVSSTDTALGFKLKQILAEIKITNTENEQLFTHAKVLVDFVQNYSFFFANEYEKDSMEAFIESLLGNIPLTRKPGIYKIKFNEFESISFLRDDLEQKAKAKQDMNIIDLQVDTSKDFELVMSEFSSVYWERKYQACLLKKFIEMSSGGINDDESHKIASESVEDIYEKSVSAYHSMWMYKAKINEDASFKLDDTPRAIGLWLWDYITNQYGESKPPHKAYAEARRVFKEKFDYVKLGYQETESGTYRNWYHRTAACIEACDVLSFKGDGRKKKTKT